MTNRYSDEEYESYEEDDVEYIDDIDLILMPKMEINVDEWIEYYYNLLKKYKRKKEIKEVLYDFYTRIRLATSIMDRCIDLQNKAKELELEIKLMQGELK